jgi:hypothetical protein
VLAQDEQEHGRRPLPHMALVLARLASVADFVAVEGRGFAGRLGGWVVGARYAGLGLVAYGLMGLIELPHDRRWLRPGVAGQ